MTKYNKLLIEMVKAAGLELNERAEELVGESELITDFNIWIRFNQESGIPTIEVDKEVIARKCIEVRREAKQ